MRTLRVSFAAMLIVALSSCTGQNNSVEPSVDHGALSQRAANATSGSCSETTTFPANFYSGSVLTALSATDAWVAGLDDSDHLSVLHYANGTITSTGQPISEPSQLPAILAIADNDVWVGGHGFDDGPYFSHWDGQKWTRIANPPELSAYLTSIQAMTALASNDVWVAAQYEPSSVVNPRLALEHWDGHAMRLVAIGPYYTNGGPKDILEFSPNNVVVLNDGLVAHSSQGQIVNWDGTHLHYHVLPVLPGQANLFNIGAQLAATSPTNIWAVGNAYVPGAVNGTARIWNFNGTWQPYVYDAGNTQPVFEGVAALNSGKTVVTAFDPTTFAPLTFIYENGIRFHQEANNLSGIPISKAAPAPGTQSFWTLLSQTGTPNVNAALINCQ